MPFPRSHFTGFPFDKDIERDTSFRNQLDDIAKRHPEIAEHFEGFPFRSNSRERRQSSEDRDGFPRFASRDRPFGSRFEQFGFPFTRDESPFTQEQAPKHQQSERQPSPPQAARTQQQSAEPQHVPANEDIQAAQKPPQGPERGRRQNIQQSNTADLTQKQEAVDDSRGQRSMSAPPPESRSQPRYVSSIHIPIQRDPAAGGDAGLGQQSPQGTPQQHHQPPQQSFKPTERVIPIHVEGRDEPVVPRNVHQTYAQPGPAPAGYAHPEPEHIFGGRNMNDFMGRNSGRFPAREDIFGRQYQMPPEPQRFPQQKQQTPPRTQPVPPQQHQQQAPPPQQQQHQQNANPPQQSAQSAPQPQEAHHQNQEQQQPQQPQKPTPIDQIKAIQKDVSELMAQVDQFTGMPRDKLYLYLDEMLTRNLIKLDNIDTQGQENIRSARREAIKCIERCIGILDSKANANLAAKEGGQAVEQQIMDVDQKPSGETKVENDGKSDRKSQEKSGEGQEQQQQAMEVSSTTNENEQAVEQNKGMEPMEVAPIPCQDKSEQKEAAAKDSSEVSSVEKAPEVPSQPSDSNAPQDELNTPKVETSAAPIATGEDFKADVEAAMPTESGDNPPAEGQDQSQPDSSSQTKEGSKDENKKEKKKGKKKEKTEKK